jgi:predicted PurR-regulated permease PerM
LRFYQINLEKLSARLKIIFFGLNRDLGKAHMTNQDFSQKLGVWIFLGFTAFLSLILVIMARPFLVAVVVGGMLALILNPWFRYLNAKMNKYAAAALATVSLALLFIIPLLLLAVVALRDASALTTMLASEETTSTFKDWLTHWRLTFEQTLATYAPWVTGLRFHDQAKGLASTMLDWSSKLVLELASETPALMVQLTMGVLSCYFWLVDGRRFLVWLRLIIPVTDHVRDEVTAAFRDATRSTVVASLAAALAQSFFVIISFLAIGIPSAALAAATTFAFAWIPVLGSFPVFAVAAFWAIAHGSWVKLTFIIVAGLITGIVDNLVRPLVLKGGSDMHPLISLVAILGGLEFFGLLGVLLGPVIVAMFTACARVWPHLAEEAGWFRTH